MEKKKKEEKKATMALKYSLGWMYWKNKGVIMLLIEMINVTINTILKRLLDNVTL